MARPIDKNSVMGRMRSLELNQWEDFPLTLMFSIRSLAAAVNATRNVRSLKTTVRRDLGVIRVTRTA